MKRPESQLGVEEDKRGLKIHEVLQKSVRVNRQFLDAHRNCAALFQVEFQTAEFRLALSEATHPIISDIKLLLDELAHAVVFESRLNDEERLASLYMDHYSKFLSEFEKLQNCLKQMSANLTMILNDLSQVARLEISEDSGGVLDRLRGLTVKKVVAVAALVFALVGDTRGDNSNKSKGGGSADDEQGEVVKDESELIETVTLLASLC